MRITPLKSVEFYWCKPTWGAISDCMGVFLPPLLCDGAELLCFAELSSSVRCKGVNVNTKAFVQFLETSQ